MNINLYITHSVYRQNRY